MLGTVPPERATALVPPTSFDRITAAAIAACGTLDGYVPMTPGKRVSASVSDAGVLVWHGTTWEDRRDEHYYATLPVANDAGGTQKGGDWGRVIERQLGL